MFFTIVFFTSVFSFLIIFSPIIRLTLLTNERTKEISFTASEILVRLRKCHFDGSRDQRLIGTILSRRSQVLRSDRTSPMNMTKVQCIMLLTRKSQKGAFTEESGAPEHRRSSWHLGVRFLADSLCFQRIDYNNLWANFVLLFDPLLREMIASVLLKMNGIK